ncbi:hypothetical protein GGU11DRAFT_878249 [Lentinula aff. detonsa]|nr:hypothetical protein GGU11DRAFT_878249 [Lentinula aff. detonsa]
MDCNRAAESTVAFNRKRKRHDAIDPCLGFYPSSLAQVAQAETIFQPLLDPQAPSIPDLYTVLIQQRIPEVPELPRIEAHAASPESLDAMLSKPGPAATPAGKKLRTYARQRRKRVPDDNGNTSSEQETSLSPSLIKRRKKSNVLRIHSPAEKTDIPPRINGRRRRPLKDRLLQAAVLSSVDPADSLIEPNTNVPAPTRKPLQFGIPDFLRNTPESRLKRRTLWNFVDPRRSTYIRTASFNSSREKQTSRANSTFRPLTEWSTSTLSRPMKKKGEAGSLKKSPSNGKRSIDTQYGSRRPLVLVPIEKSKSLQASPRRNSRQTSQFNPDVENANLKAPRPLILVNGLTKNTPITDSPIPSTNRFFPTLLLSQPSTPCIDLAGEVSNGDRGSVSDPTSVSSYTANPPFVSAAELVSSSPKLAKSLPPNPQDYTVLAPCSTPSASTSESPRIITTLEIAQHPHMSSSPVRPTRSTDVPPVNSQILKGSATSLSHSDITTGTASSSKKHAKPLSSFFDEFLETIRAATSASDIQKTYDAASKGRRRRLVNSRIAERAVNPTGATQSDGFSGKRDHGGIFDGWSFRGVSKAEYEGKQDEKSAHMSSPDFSAESRSRHQIMLSPLSPRPPTTQPKSIRSSMAVLRAFYE